MTNRICTVSGDAAACQVGDVVKAIYTARGDKYDANIAGVDGDKVTVNWSDGDPKYRDVSNQNVFKNGVSCQLLAGK